MRSRGHAFVAASLLATTPAAAQNPVRSVAFSWVRGEGADRCPSLSEMSSAVRSRLGRDPFSATAPVSAEATVDRVDARWRARLLFRDPQGAVLLRRELDDASDDCSTIASAVVVSVTLGLAPAGDTPPLAPAPPPTPVVIVRPVPSRERSRVTLSAEALWGALPGVAFGAVARLDVPLTRRLGLYGSVALEPERRTPAPDDSWAFGMTRASLGACARVHPFSRLELDGCAGASFGLTHAVTFGPTPLAPGNYPWFGVVADARAVVRPVRPLVVELGASVAWVMVRNDFIVTGALPTTVYRQQGVALTGSAGLGVEF